MGATPVTALQILCWPRDLDAGVAARVLDGAAEVLGTASCSLLGGHSIDDPTPKFGLSVTGLGQGPALTNAGAVPGDALVLTKALGTGVVTAANAARAVEDETLAAAVESMARLNADAAEVARTLGAHAVTDVTGFGLVGHLHEICRASGVSADIHAELLPVLPAVRSLIELGHLSGGTRRNRAERARRRPQECRSRVGAHMVGLRRARPPEVCWWRWIPWRPSPRSTKLRGRGHPATLIGELNRCGADGAVVRIRDGSQRYVP
ncbi:MAG: selenide, water dikinase SelD [Microthrixaceae bacterium]